MFTLLVTVDVRADRIEDFLEAATANAIASLRDEPGCLAFDVHRDNETPTRFYFYEVYTDEDAVMSGHRTSPHYLQWQEAAEDVLVEDGRQVTFAQPVHLGFTPS
ncbi:MAG: antibiotic biosynthesis monooxygenase [Mycobacterium sp.]